MININFRNNMGIMHYWIVALWLANRKTFLRNAELALWDDSVVLFCRLKSRFIVYGSLIQNNLCAMSDLPEIIWPAVLISHEIVMRMHRLLLISIRQYRFIAYDCFYLYGHL